MGMKTEDPSVIQSILRPGGTVVDVLKTQLLACAKDMGAGEVECTVTVSDKPEHGDYASNIALVLARVLKRNPMEIATELQTRLMRDFSSQSPQVHQTHAILHQNAGKEDESPTQSGEMVVLDKVDVAPPGFINIFLSPEAISTRVDRVLNRKEGDGKRQDSAELRVESLELSKKKKVRALKKQRVMIEFADPNPYKEFHIGHLRNITLGEAFARGLEAIGCEVRRVNYQGDVGMHVSKSLWGLRNMLEESARLRDTGIDPRVKAAILGQAYSRGATNYETSETAKQEIININKQVYRDDPSIREEWAFGRQISLDYFDLVYKRVGTIFSRFYFESEVAPKGMQIVLEHIEDGIFERSDGAIIYRGEKAGLHTRVFVSKEQYATYEAKDLALAPLKYTEYQYDLSIIMTGNEQSPYFSVMFAALKEIDPVLAGKTRHIPFGMVNLSTGKMSSRTGHILTAEWLLDEAKKKINIILSKNASKYTESETKEIAEKAAVSAVKYAMLRVGAASDIAFDIDTSISFDGDSGPYLQYTYARCKSVLRKSKNVSTLEIRLSNVDLNPEERALAMKIIQFDDVVADAAVNFAPNTLCTYLFELAQSFNTFYAKHSILGELSAVSSQPSAYHRLALTAATAQVLKDGLYLLGIETVERM
jgi:arginyl-tRNA synthetase